MGGMTASLERSFKRSSSIPAAKKCSPTRAKAQITVTSMGMRGSLVTGFQLHNPGALSPTFPASQQAIKQMQKQATMSASSDSTFVVQNRDNLK